MAVAKYSYIGESSAPLNWWCPSRSGGYLRGQRDMTRNFDSRRLGRLNVRNVSESTSNWLFNSWCFGRLEVFEMALKVLYWLKSL